MEKVFRTPRKSPWMGLCGNDIAPHTPIENIQAMVAAGREFGIYR